MKLIFSIDFITNWGQTMFVFGSLPELGNWDEQKAVPLTYNGKGACEAIVETNDFVGNFLEYKYFLVFENGNKIEWEWGNNRKINSSDVTNIVIKDFWRSQYNDNNVFFSSAFTKVLTKRRKNTPQSGKGKSGNSFFLNIRINAPKVHPLHQIGIIGSNKALGHWKSENVVLLDEIAYPLWEAHFDVENISFPFEYKYVIVDTTSKNIILWEEGENRKVEEFSIEKDKTHVRTDETLRLNLPPWKGAGVSIPVFALRTKNGFGIGEFSDLKLFTDWAAKNDLKMVQILPINDTTSTHTWTDSYPYSSISVFALHPIYLDLDVFLRYFSRTDRKKYRAQQQKLNSLEKIDYEEVLRLKHVYIGKAYKALKKKLLKDDGFVSFFNQNKTWLVPYATFCFLRDQNNTADFNEWKEFARYDTEKIKKLTFPKTKHYDEIAIHYFIQYHLHKQLKGVVEYAHSKNIVMKGDIPIGISPLSVEAWEKPYLFNMDMQAGAPPDDFAVIGQNWELPTYKWEEMEKDNYLWWRSRFQNMAAYFDAYRIDHILGFFRIWQIPSKQKWGLMGQFNPALLYDTQELQSHGLKFDYDRFCRPYIREYFLENIFGDQTADVKEKYLDDKGNGVFELKEIYNTQSKIFNFFEVNSSAGKSNDDDKQIKKGLMVLCAEVLFIPVSNNDEEKYHPRISLHYTYSYRGLDEYTKSILNKIYIDFFYNRHNEFWKMQAMQKLPVLVNATDMLVCGEDLGMVPDCVPQVMRDLKILSLEIQRMPKNPKVEFAHPADAPYLSVCTPSSHDMSTIRGWWEEDREKTQKFFNHVMGKFGEAPFFAEPWLCREIVAQHLYSPAMWAVFPLQDLLAMDEKVRWEKTHDERINIPAIPKHYWRYRMHISIEDLINSKDLNTMLKLMVNEAGRNV